MVIFKKIMNVVMAENYSTRPSPCLEFGSETPLI